MARILDLKTFTDERGNLTVIEKIIPFEIKRIFYIYGVDNSSRGNHRHKQTIQVAISLQGKCDIYCKSGDNLPTEKYELNSPQKCLILEANDFHWMKNFSKDCILMVLASQNYDADDYIFDNYK